jgi:prepilin signal peptidase PulO-like enzyme (type II secretory pathway)
MDYDSILAVAFATANFWIFSVVSSYYSVVVHRGFKDSIIKPSHCDYCGTRLPFWTLVPVISIFTLLMMGGKTHCCGRPVSRKYLLTEIFAGIVGVIVAIALLSELRTPVEAAFLYTSALVFLFLAIQDFWVLEINLEPTVLLIFIHLAALFFAPNLIFSAYRYDVSLESNLLTGFVAALIVGLLIIASRGKGLGIGDVLLLFLVGVSLGPAGTLFASQITIYLAAGFGLAYAAYKRKLRGQIVALVPFIYLGWLLAFAAKPALELMFRQLLPVF